MKKIIIPLISVLLTGTPALAGDWASVVPFGYEGDVNPRDLIQYEIVKEGPFNHMSFTFTVAVSKVSWRPSCSSRCPTTGSWAVPITVLTENCRSMKWTSSRKGIRES